MMVEGMRNLEAQLVEAIGRDSEPLEEIMGRKKTKLISKLQSEVSVCREGGKRRLKEQQKFYESIEKDIRKRLKEEYGKEIEMGTGNRQTTGMETPAPDRKES